MDISRHQLDFRVLVESDDDVDFFQVDIAELKTIEEIRDLWPKVNNSAHLFGNSLSNAIREKGLFSSFMFLYLEPQKPPYDMKGIAYLENVHVVPIVIKFSQNINQWIASILESFVSRQPNTIKFNISPDGTSTAYSYVKSDTSNHFSLEGLEYSPIKSILYNAPRNFDPKATKLKKEEFTKNHVVAAPVLNDDEKQVLKNKWEELIENSSIPEKPGTQIDEFKEFESITGFPIPTELRIIYEASNNRNRPLGPLMIRSFSDLLLDCREVKLNYDACSMEGLTEFTKTDGELTSKIFCHTHRVPFALRINGDQVAYDLIPGKEGQAGQIVAIESRDERIVWIAGSLLEFIGLLDKEQNSKKWHSQDTEANLIEELRVPMGKLKRSILLHRISSRFYQLKNVVCRFLGK